MIDSFRWFRSVLVAVVSGVAYVAYPAASTESVFWQADADGNPSGNWSDTSH